MMFSENVMLQNYCHVFLLQQQWEATNEIETNLCRILFLKIASHHLL